MTMMVMRIAVSSEEKKREKEKHITRKLEELELTLLFSFSILAAPPGIKRLLRGILQGA